MTIGRFRFLPWIHSIPTVASSRVEGDWQLSSDPTSEMERGQARWLDGARRRRRRGVVHHAVSRAPRVTR